MIRWLGVASLLFFSVWACEAGAQTTFVRLPGGAQEILAPAALDGTVMAQDMRFYGYVQEEYLYSGRANIYERDPAGKGLRVRRADVPYTNRILLIRPADPEDFSGTLQFTFSHPSMAADNWRLLAAYVMRHGDAVAIVQAGGDPARRAESTAQRPTATPLLFQWFDSERYAGFSWPEDDGIRWDTTAAAILLLRDPQGPAAPLHVERLFMSGHSYLGALVRTFVVEGFHDRARLADGSAGVDGYLAMVSPRSFSRGLQPLSSQDPPIENDPRPLPDIDVPFVELLSENETILNRAPQLPDRDTYAGGHRLYEVAGVSHRDAGVDLAQAPISVQLSERLPASGPVVEQCPGEPSDVPMRDVMNAALNRLEHWRITGEAPPSAARLVMDGDDDFARDANGNPAYGVRLAQLDVPLASYRALPRQACTPPTTYRNVRRFAFDRAQLDRLYPLGAQQYLSAFAQRLHELVEQHWLLPQDALRQLEKARADAAAAWSEPNRTPAS